jgi:ribosomal protein S10
MCASLKGRNRDEAVASSLSAARRKKRRNREPIPLNTYYTKFAIYEDPTVESSIRF